MSILESIANALSPYTQKGITIQSPEERANIIVLLNGYFSDLNKPKVISLDDITFEHATSGLGDAVAELAQFSP